MKKRIALLLSMLLLAVSLTACGDKNNESDKTNVTEMKVEKYVTLGEYKGLAVTAPKVEVCCRKRAADETGFQSIYHQG